MQVQVYQVKEERREKRGRGTAIDDDDMKLESKLSYLACRCNDDQALRRYSSPIARDRFLLPSLLPVPPLPPLLHLSFSNGRTHAHLLCLFAC